MALNLPTTVKNFLATRPDQKFTAREIAQWIFEEFPGECQKKKDASAIISSDAELITQIAAEIGAYRPKLQKKWPELRTIEGPPRLYYWDAETDQDEIPEVDHANANFLGTSGESQAETPETPRMEEELYPLLCKYLYTEHNIRPLHINDKKSSNKKGRGGNRWLHPDLVGMESLQENWHSDIKSLAKECFGKRIRLWSFEVKLELTRNNVREYFLQAVTNSSWANFGYLVAETINNKSLEELRMLASLHGIGLIELNFQNPYESRIIIPARERPEVDWATCSRLAEENEDFLQFTLLVRQFLQTVHPSPSREWDLPEEPDLFDDEPEPYRTG